MKNIRARNSIKFFKVDKFWSLLFLGAIIGDATVDKACSQQRTVSPAAYSYNATIYIDKSQKVAIPGPFDFGGPFIKGIAEVGSHSDGTIISQYVNRSGAKIEFSKSNKTGTSIPAENLRAIRASRGVLGFGDCKGNFVPINCDWAQERFDGDYALITKKQDENVSQIIDPRGRVVKALNEVESYGGLVNGRLKFRSKEHRFGYCDATGKVVIPAKYLTAQLFSEGFATVSSINENQVGVIDKTGKLVVPEQYDFVGPFSEGLAYFRRQTVQGYLTTNGTEKFKLQGNVSAPGQFHEGLARIAIGGANDFGKPDKVARPRSKIGFINVDGAVVIAPKFSVEGTQDFSEGYAVVGIGDGDKERFGYIDKTGAWVIKPQLMAATSFSEGLTAVALEHAISKELQQRYRTNAPPPGRSLRAIFKY